MTSSYLTLPSRGEEEARAEIAERNELVRQFNAMEVVSGEKAQGAFLKVVQTASEERTTAALLSRARTFSRCLWENENLYEDEYNAKIVAFCTTLMDGNPVAGMLLASAAVFGGSKYV